MDERLLMYQTTKLKNLRYSEEEEVFGVGAGRALLSKE
jgi:hypothetical protein